MRLKLTAYPSGDGAGNKGCAAGPAVFRDWANGLNWSDFPPAAPDGSQMDKVLHYCKHLKQQTQAAVADGFMPVTIGGDHAMAIASWSGIAEQKKLHGKLGLIWIDAHMDAHTQATSPSGFIHGMPLSYLLGFGNDALNEVTGKTPVLSPQHLCLIGIRSFEQGEHDTLVKAGVRIFYMDEVKERGMMAVMQEALTIAAAGTDAFGLSLDLDGVDPADAPAVGCREKNGLTSAEVLHSIKGIGNKDGFSCLEIAEYNPDRDVDFKTANLIKDVISSVFAR